MSEEKSESLETLTVQPLDRPPVITLQVPGSKSITNRALVLAALSDPRHGSDLSGILQSEDTEVMVTALRTLGFRVQIDWSRGTAHVGRGAHVRTIPVSEANLFVMNSGTSMRFLTALVSLGHGRYRLDGVARMRERPIEDLLSALRQLSVQASSERNNGFPPVVVQAKGLNGGRVRLKGDVSSQFLSGLLMAAPLARSGLTIEVEGPLVSVPYVAMTVAMMRRFGVEVDTDLASSFQVPAHPCYQALSFAVEPDASAASYFFGAAAITGGKVTVAGLGRDSLQGDVRFVEVLKEMGCVVAYGSDGLTVEGRAEYGVDADLNAMSDCVMTLAAVACFARGPTTIRNVAHIRHKETDRLQALAMELRRVGAGVEEFADGLTITPGPLHGALIDTYNDHRMAMSMALVGLKIPGITLRNPACVAKTYPRFFDDLDRLHS